MAVPAVRLAGWQVQTLSQGVLLLGSRYAMLESRGLTDVSWSTVVGRKGLYLEDTPYRELEMALP